MYRNRNEPSGLHDLPQPLDIFPVYSFFPMQILNPLYSAELWLPVIMIPPPPAR